MSRNQRDRQQAWKREVYGRLSSTAISALKGERFVRLFLAPLKPIVTVGLVCLLLLGFFFDNLGDPGSIRGEQLALFRCALVLWFLAGSWKLASAWTHQARFSEGSRTCFLLPDRNREAWNAAGRSMRMPLVLLAVECVGVTWWIAHVHQVPSHSLLTLFLLMALAVGGLSGWWLLLAACRRRFDLPFGVPKGIVVITLLGTSMFAGYIALNYVETARLVVESAWRVFGHFPLLGPAVGWMEEGSGMGAFPPFLKTAWSVLVPAVIPWFCWSWMSRRFSTFADRFASSLLALHWPRTSRGRRRQRESPSLNPPEARDAADRSQAKGSLPFPVAAVAPPRWALIERLILALLNDRERLLLRAANPKLGGRFTRDWILAGVCCLLSGGFLPLFAAIDVPDSMVRFLFLLLLVLVPLGLALWFALGGMEVDFWTQAIRMPQSAFPFFAGLPVSLRDLAVADWKIMVLRSLLAIPWFLGVALAVPVSDPGWKTGLPLGVLTVLLALIACWPLRIPSNLAKRVGRPRMFSAASWWQALAGVSVAVTVVLLPLGSALFLAEGRWVVFLPLLATGLSIPILAFCLIHWFLHTRVDTTLEMSSDEKSA